MGSKSAPLPKPPTELDEQHENQKLESQQIQNDEPEKINKKEEDSNEDRRIEEEINMLMKRLRETETELYLPVLQLLRELLRSSTTSITSVPKPLKYMRSHYDTMKKIYTKIQSKKIKEDCADIISVLAMTMSNENKNECLTYRLLANQKINICEWGHEYVRYLSSEIASEWIKSSKISQEKLLPLIHQIIPFTLNHNAEAEACDLLMEIEQLNLLLNYVDENSYSKIFLYLISCVPYVAEPENTVLLRFLQKMTIEFKKYVEATRIALMLNDYEVIPEIFDKSPDNITRIQIAFLIARQRVTIDFSKCSQMPDDQIMEIISNANLNQYFFNLARDLDVLEAKGPENIYKSHSDYTRTHINSQIDSARTNLALSFVNAFLNTGFGNDIMFDDYGSFWIYKNKDHGMLSATASLGLIKLWDLDGGLTIIDKYLYSTDDNIKAGALLGVGILNCGIRSEVEPAHALLSDYLWNSSETMQIAAILGIGIAYAGSNNPLVLDSLRKLLRNGGHNTEVTGVLAISLSLIAVGTCNGEDTELILEQAIWCDEFSKEFHYIRTIFLGLGLLYLGSQSKSEVLIESLQILHSPFKQYGTAVVEMCSYAGTGDVLKVQNFLHICSEHYEKKDKKENKSDKKDKDKEKETEFNFIEVQKVAVIGVALLSMGDEIGIDMSYRTFGHLMRYGDSRIRRAVPLAIALTYISNPKPNVADMLYKFSHDSDNDVALSAIFALGLIGAGTNNAKIANLLRQAAQYYAKDSSTLFIVRIAQGLTHLAKGTVTLSPYHSDRMILRPCSVAALLNIIFVGLDLKNLLLGSAHYLLFLLTPAIEPRCLITFDDKLNQIQVPVRTGIAVDIVAQAGKPKTITSFQTHTSPVLLNVGERAELATDDYISASPVLEGFVVLKKNE